MWGSWLRLYISKIPIYPIFYLIKRDYSLQGAGLRVEGLEALPPDDALRIEAARAANSSQAVAEYDFRGLGKLETQRILRDPSMYINTSGFQAY